MTTSVDIVVGVMPGERSRHSAEHCPLFTPAVFGWPALVGAGLFPSQAGTEGQPRRVGRRRTSPTTRFVPQP